jgi:hypothetical protein
LPHAGLPALISPPPPSQPSQANRIFQRFFQVVSWHHFWCRLPVQDSVAVCQHNQQKKIQPGSKVCLSALESTTIYSLGQNYSRENELPKKTTRL